MIINSLADLLNKYFFYLDHYVFFVLLFKIYFLPALEFFVYLILCKFYNLQVNDLIALFFFIEKRKTQKQRKF